MVQKHVLDHLATTQEGGHRLQQGFRGPEKAHAGGAAELVGRPDKKINTESAHIQRLMRQALTSIEEHFRALLPGQGHHLRNGIAAAEGVADVHQCNQPGALVELGAQILQIQAAGFSETHMAQHTTGALRQQLPGHQVAVVLHHGEEHFIALAEIGISPGASHKVDRLTGIAREDDLAGAGGGNETRCGRARRLKRFGRPGAELMGAAVHIGVISAVVMLKRFEHHPGFLAGGGVIEIDQGRPIRGGLGQDREIGARALGQIDHRSHPLRRDVDTRTISTGDHDVTSASRPSITCQTEAAAGS